MSKMKSDPIITDPIVIDDLDLRCDWIFPEILERCWLLSSKTFSYKGRVRGKFCIYHYELGLQLVASTIARERITPDGQEQPTKG